MKKGIIIIICGPSGVGKGTIRKRLCEICDFNFGFSVSYCTRKPRQNEIDGVDYFFVSNDVFQEMIKNNEFLEYNHFVDHYYGTSKNYVEQLLEKGKNVILEIDLNGARNISNIYSKDELISFFILPPNMDVLKERLSTRNTETDSEINGRLNKAIDEIKEATFFDYKIINDNLDKAVNEIKDLIEKKLN